MWRRWADGLTLWRLSRRQMRTHPGRAALTTLSVVIGVASVVAVSLSITTTRKAYRDMSHAMSGRAGIEVVSVSGGGFDATIAAKVAATPGVSAVASVIQRSTILYAAEGHRAKTLALGIEPRDAEAVHDYHLAEGQWFGDGAEAVLDSHYAESLGIGLGDEVKLLAGRRGMQRVKVVGLAAPRGVAGLMRGGTLFLSLATAQRIFSAPQQVDVLQVVLADKAKPADVEKRLGELLPTDLVCRSPSTRTQMGEETLRSAEQGLGISGLLSVVLAIFIILNTFLMSVTERRPQLAILRAIGATRNQTMRMLLREGLVLGVGGSALGIGVGIGGAYLLMRAVERAQYTSLPGVDVSWPPLLFGGALGVGLSLLTSYWPARRASSVSPLEGLGVHRSADLGEIPKRLAIIGGGLILIGSVVLGLAMSRVIPIEGGTPGGLCMLIGCVLLVPVALDPLTRLAAKLPALAMPVEARLAQGSLLRHPIRGMLTIGVLFIAISTGIMVGTQIFNNTNDVHNWLDQTLRADFFVRATMPDMATGLSTAIPESVGPTIQATPGVEYVGSMRIVSTKASGEPAVIIVKDFQPTEHLALDLKAGTEAEVLAGLRRGEVVIATLLSQRTKLTLGDQLKLETREGAKQVRICGVTNEYLLGGMALYMERETARTLLGIEGVDAFMVKADPEHRAGVETALRALCDEGGLLLQSATDVRHIVTGMMSGIVGCLWGLLSLALVVSAFSIVNTLTMNVMEQTRELALLRVVAMTRRQVRRTIFCQAAILGLIGLVPGVFVGAGLAYLTHIGMTSKLGHVMDFAAHPWYIASLFAAAYGLVIIAAWIPAERAARLELLAALHYE